MVEWKPIDSLGNYFGGLTGKSKKDFENGNAKFITYMNVFSNPSLDVSTVEMVHINEGERQNKVQKGDILFTGSSETPDEAGMSCVVTDDLDEDYYMNSFCFGLRLLEPEQYNLNFFKHVFRSYVIRKAISKSASGVTRFNISKARFGKILIPIPSLLEQNRIVGILDTFTASIDNLKEQIALRRKQFEYYRDQLLDLEGKESVDMKVLSEVCESNRGVRVVKNELQESGLFPVFQNSLAPMGYYHKCNYGKPTPFVITAGAAGEVGFCDTPFWAADDCLCLTCSKTVLPKYVFYFLAKYNFYLKTKVRKGAIPRLSRKVVESLLVPVIDIESQNKIINKLETFEASIKNLEAQLDLRQKQYEYYRNKLLTF